MPYFVYILMSQKDQSFYIGQTQNLDDRLTRHNQGRSRYTKTKMPWSLVHYESFENRQTALKREAHLKSLRNKKSILEIISPTG